MTDPLRSALADHGLIFSGHIHADGKLHRFKADGDHDRNSWYVAHTGPPAAGAFGCWKRGFKETWCEHSPGMMSQADWDRVRARWKEAELDREQEETRAHVRAAEIATWIMSKSVPVDSHEYLTRKGVTGAGDLRTWRGSLAVPMRDLTGNLTSLQFILADGTKRFLRGGTISGSAFTIPGPADAPLHICEGVATGLTVHEATGAEILCAMNCGNLLAVAKAARAKWPDREIVIAADNDQWTEGNPGASKATEAARAIGSRLALPTFAQVSSKPTDFNDLHQREGLRMVTQQITDAATPPETQEESFARLASLPLADYDRVRKKESERLGIRAATLDQLVAELREVTGESTQGQSADLANVPPWDSPVDGAAVLDQVASCISDYVALPDGAADAISLWIGGAHCFECFVHSPRLNLFSPEKGCGKTTLLDVIGALAPRPMRTESITSAVLFRIVESHKPTLLLDEVDAYLSEAEELRGLLNAGHKRGAKAYRCEGDSHDVRAFNCFSPAVLAGIGNLPATLHDRSIIIRLVRAKPGEVGARFDSRKTDREYILARKLARFTADNADALAQADPAMPGSAHNRVADNWRPLFAIADLAGSGWRARAEAAFAKLAAGTDDAQGIGCMMLEDIRNTFATSGTDRLPSAKLAEVLHTMEGRPWPEYGKHRKPISPPQIAGILRKFGISPDTIRFGQDSAKGYHLGNFEDAFARFLPNTVSDRNSVTKQAGIEQSSGFNPLQTPPCYGSKNTVSANNDGPCYGVTAQNPENPTGAHGDLL